MSKTNIADRPVSVNIHIERGAENTWIVTPELKAAPAPIVVKPKNIIFLLDVSSSMEGERLSLVKAATQGLLRQLTPSDSFSIVSFNSNAKTLINKKPGTPYDIGAAINLIENMSASNGTSFVAAFTAINRDKLLQGNNSTIIFLTDGEDNTAKADVLVGYVREKKKCPRIIPIGVAMEDNDHLNKIAKEANGNKIKPIYIQEQSSEAYLKAFQEAFDLTQEQSKQFIQLEMTVAANTPKDPKNSTQVTLKRELDRLSFDSKSGQDYHFVLDSKYPPSSCKFRFICDDIHLEGHHTFTPKQRQEMNEKGKLSLSIPKLKWKDNSVLSWLKCIGTFFLGLALLAGAAAFFLFLSPLSFMLTAGISAGAALVGLGLVGYGLVDFLRKTIFLPTKTTTSMDAASKSIEAAESKQNDQAAFNKNKKPSAPSQNGHFGNHGARDKPRINSQTPGPTVKFRTSK